MVNGMLHMSMSMAWSMFIGVMNVSSYPNDVLVDEATYSFYLTIYDLATNPSTTLLQPVIYGT